MIAVPRAAVRRAEELVLALITWEVYGGADGEGYSAACEEFGVEVMERAMERVAKRVTR